MILFTARKERWPGLLVTNPAAPAGGYILSGNHCYVYSMAYTEGSPILSPLIAFPREEAAGFHLAVFHGSYGRWGRTEFAFDPKGLAQAGYHYVALGIFIAVRAIN